MTQTIKAVVPGQFTPVVFKKDFDERNGAIVTKITRGVFRLGLNASHLKNYEHKGNGLKEGDKWERFPFLIDCSKGKKIRLYSTYNEKMRPMSDYFVTIAGETRPTSKDEILEKDWVVPSKLSPKRNGIVHMFDVFLSNIIKIGK